MGSVWPQWHDERVADASTGYALDSPEYRRISIALFLAGLVTFALLYATQPLLPTLSQEFGVSAAVSALSVSFATIGLGFALLIAGPVSEVRGRTPLMFSSLFASCGVGLACALAPTWTTLLVLRGLEGIVLAGLPAVAMAYLAEEMDRTAQARAAALYVAGTAIGAMLGRLVTGGVADLFGWRAGLFAVAAMGLFATIVVRRLLPPSRNFRPAPSGIAHLRSSTRAMLTDPGLLALFGIGGASLGAFVGTFNAVGFRLHEPPYALSVGVAGLIYLVYSLGSMSSAYAGRLAAAHGYRKVAPWAALVLLGGVLLTLPSPLWLLVTGLAVVSVGFFALHALAAGWVAARASIRTGAPGQASATYLVCYYAGSSVFGGLAGWAWTSGGWIRVVELTGGLVVVALLLTLLLRRIPSLREADQPDPGVVGY